MQMRVAAKPYAYGGGGGGSKEDCKKKVAYGGEGGGCEGSGGKGVGGGGGEGGGTAPGVTVRPPITTSWVRPPALHTRTVGTALVAETVYVTASPAVMVPGITLRSAVHEGGGGGDDGGVGGG